MRALLSRRVGGSFSPAILGNRPACFLHQDFESPINKSKNIFLLFAELTLKASRFDNFFTKNINDTDWVIITHGIKAKNGETKLSCGLDSEISPDELLTKIPKNSTVYLAFCYQLSDEKWQELSAKHSSLKIIAFGNVAKINTLRTISSLSATLTSREILETYSNPLNLIRVFEAGQKLEEIQPLDYLEKPNLEINGCNIKIDPVFLGDAILKQCPEKISDFFKKFSQHFLPADIEKIDQTISEIQGCLEKQANCHQLLKQFFINCLHKKTLEQAISTKHFLSLSFVQKREVKNILASLGSSCEMQDLTQEYIDNLSCFLYGVKTKPLPPQINVHRVEAIAQDTQSQLS